MANDDIGRLAETQSAHAESWRQGVSSNNLRAAVLGANELASSEIAKEAEEIERTPLTEQRQLVLIYQAQGVARTEAERIASDLMSWRLTFGHAEHRHCSGGDAVVASRMTIDSPMRQKILLSH